MNVYARYFPSFGGLYADWRLAGTVSLVPCYSVLLALRISASLHDAPLPELLPDTFLVRTAAIVINPIDAKMLDHGGSIGAVSGYDFAGTVIAAGENVLKSGCL